MIRVLIVDDHPVVREGLAALIDRRADMTVVGEALDGAQAVEIALERRPDVILMDLRMPGMGGVAAIETLRERLPTARCIVLTTYDGDEDIYRGIRAGAFAYLLKDAPRETLLETVRAVAAGHKRIPPEIAAKLMERMTAPDLTARELEVLEQIVRGRSNREIARALDIAEGTVKVHVNSILGKLGVSDRTQAATSAIQRGIVRL